MNAEKAMKAGEATDDTHTSAFAAYELGMSLCRNLEIIMENNTTQGQKGQKDQKEVCIS